MGRELLAVIEQIGREKGIDTGRILEAVESALLTAAKKKYGAAENIQVRIDRKSGEVEAISLKKIVNEVTNPKSEVSLEEARRVDTEAELGDEIGSVIEIEDFGRIAAQTAKQVIFQKVREAGDRTKIAVASRDRAVDPVGACVGMKGSRVQAVVRELRGEKIDIIAWTADSRVFIAEALNPAVIEKVGLDEEKKSALVVVADNQLSLAIGRNGQNVRLAAKLTGWKIDIIGASEYEKERVVRDQETRAAIAQQVQEQHARLVQAESAAAAAQQASAEEAEPQATPAAGAPDSEAATG